MTTLIVGASGATGKCLLKHLLDRGQDVRVIVRSKKSLPDDVRDHPKLMVVEKAVLDLSDSEMQQHVAGCTAVASCLGHNLTLSGVYGNPRTLVKDATSRLCKAIEANQPSEKVKFVLMNSTGCVNKDLGEEKKIGWAQWATVGIIRNLVPPHYDNEQANEFLRSTIKDKSPYVDWVIARPDSLIDSDKVSPYTAHVSPLSDPIFNSGSVTRINVAHFMADMCTDRDGLFTKWKGQMPVLYNDDAHPKTGKK